MSREQVRNLEISRVGATKLNEFEYQKHQGEITEQEHGGQQGGGAKKLTQAERVAQITEAAHKKVEAKRKKAGLKAKTTAAKSPAKKRAAKSPAKKKAAKTRAASKGKKKR